MATTLGQLCKYAGENYKMQLICGKENLNNLVNWVHMLEDPETAYFLHGKELVITTGIGQKDTEWFVPFVKALIENDASGLVLNIGPYIKEVPKDLKEYCNGVGFPLLTIPWETRIVDVTNDFCHRIIRQEENQMTVASAFRNAIFSPDKPEEYQPILEKKAYVMQGEFSVIALSLSTIDKSSHSQYEKKIHAQLARTLFRKSERFSIFKQNQYTIVVMQGFDKELIDEALKELELVGRLNPEEYHFHAGIVLNEPNIHSLPLSYKRAIEVLKLARKRRVNHMHYEGMGLYQLLIEIEDTEVLKRFYKTTIGKLKDFDSKNDTDYYDVLECYLNNNNSVAKVAESMFVHRNTINYKIKKIKEILGVDLNYKDNMELLLAFKIKEVL